MLNLVLILLKENTKLKNKFKEFRKNKQTEVDQQISIMWSKFAIGAIGGVGVTSYIIGRLSR